MHNINAFFKMKYLDSKKTLDTISMDLNLDKAYLSRVFNNKIGVKKTRNLKKLCQYFGVNYDTLFEEDKAFEDLINQFYEEIYYLSQNIDPILKKLLSYRNKYQNTPYVIDILVVEFAYNTIEWKYNHQWERQHQKLQQIEASMDQLTQEAFYTFSFHAFNDMNTLGTAKVYQEKCKNIHYHNKYLETIFLYSNTSFCSKLNQNTLSLENYVLCNRRLQEDDNKLRLLNLRIIYINSLMQHKRYEEGIEEYLKILEIYQAKDCEIDNSDTIYNNIACAYFQLKEYEKAIEYYYKTLKYREDIDICFEAACCLYKLGKKEEAIKYINMAKKSDVPESIYHYLVEWLELFVERPYNQKGNNILLKGLKPYEKELTENIKNFIYTELYNYHVFHKDYEMAIKYSSQLLKQSVTSAVEIN